MKRISFGISLIVMLSIIHTDLFAQSGLKTDTITVFGNCGMCKERIEEAAYLKGVKSASWNKSTKILTVVYNNKKVGLENITAAVAKVGHDSGGTKATDSDYSKIPACCAYRTGSCDHD